jgi:hypothetical protein
MIKLTYRDINESDFGHAWPKLSNAVGLPFPLLYSISKIQAKLVKEAKASQELRQKLIEKYADKDENGAPKSDGPGRVKLKPETMPEFRAEMEQLLAVEFTIDRDKLTMTPKDVETAKLSAFDLVALEPVLNEISA